MRLCWCWSAWERLFQRDVGFIEHFIPSCARYSSYESQKTHARVHTAPYSVTWIHHIYTDDSLRKRWYCINDSSSNTRLDPDPVLCVAWSHRASTPHRLWGIIQMAAGRGSQYNALLSYPSMTILYTGPYSIALEYAAGCRARVALKLLAQSRKTWLFIVDRRFAPLDNALHQ